MATFNMQGFAVRLVFALLLVLLTYNPSGYSYADWILRDYQNFNPYMAIAGLVLIIGWAIYLRATMRALGFFGIVLMLAACACFVWLLVYWGWLTLEASGPIAWICSVLVAMVLAVGMSWSHVRRRLSGQVDMDDVDED